jgi:hypothetical protein
MIFLLFFLLLTRCFSHILVYFSCTFAFNDISIMYIKKGSGGDYSTHNKCIDMHRNSCVISICVFDLLLLLFFDLTAFTFHN